jgi:hypothetical protein
MAKSKSRISSIRIGGIDYKIEHIQNLRDESGKLDARISHSQTVVQLDDDMSDQGSDQALLHEIVHGMLTQMGRQKIGRDEGLVDAFAYSLYQIIRDNPRLIRRILEQP